MKKLFFITIMILLHQNYYTQNHKFFSVDGKNIIDLNGNSILLKGINLGNWLLQEGYMFHFEKINSELKIHQVVKELLGPAEARNFWNQFRDYYITEADIKFIKESGFNHIRIPFNFRLFAIEDHPELFIDDGFQYIDKALEWCKKYELYIVLDMHAAPGGQTGDNIDDSYGYPFLYENKDSRELTISIWKRIAERYKDENIIIGYDLLNEPIAHFFDTQKLNPYLEPLFKDITDAIREVDSNHIVFIGGAQWNSNFSVFGKPFDAKAVYTFHKYWSAADVSVIQDYIDFREKYNVPIWLGESGENTDEWINEFRITLESHNIGWCFWPFKKMDSERGVVSFEKFDEWEKIIEYAESSRNSFEDIRKLKPDSNLINKAFNILIENIKFDKCSINENYLRALGLME